MKRTVTVLVIVIMVLLFVIGILLIKGPQGAPNDATQLFKTVQNEFQKQFSDSAQKEIQAPVAKVRNKKSKAAPNAPYKNLELAKGPAGAQVVKRKGYTLCYSEEHEQPYWAAYMLCKSRLNGSSTRSNDFRPDPDITTGSADLDDYRRSGYDRGHMVPSGDMSWDSEAQNETFLLSNMSPQTHDFNAGVWLSIEQRVRRWASLYDTVFIATGPVLRKGLPAIGHNKVSVPKLYYKVVFVPSLKQGVAFLVPHSGTKTAPQYLVTIDSVESLTGIDFFYQLPKRLQDKVESQCDRNKWDFR